jgi:YD repeat-containing protein
MSGTPTIPDGPTSPFYKYTYRTDGTRETEQDPEGTSPPLVRHFKRAWPYPTRSILDLETATVRPSKPEGGHPIPAPSYRLHERDFGWRLTTDSPDTGSAAYNHDDAGNLTESTDANGVTRLVSDLLDRLGVSVIPTEPI